MQATRLIALPALLVVSLFGLAGCGDNDNSGLHRAGEPIEFRCFDAGDRRIVVNHGFLDLVPPASLTGIADGVTVSMFAPEMAPLSDGYIEVFFTTRGHFDGQCSVGVSSSTRFGNVVPVRAGTRHGLTFVFSQSDLVALLATIRSGASTDDCSDVSTNDLSITGVVAFGPVGDGFVPLDGIAIGATADTLPTRATLIPDCLAVAADAP